ncbi:hypothetical protein [Pseudomonas syringae group genomosp. 7]|uniref:hypothetical protein n=1 Tax=Pseudomonas syringae group genomosp. 7 TaxID=251699 RepID=UPI000F000DD8|nr:hypothetical protein [Pseudomonas syringae group genomosp. 7]RMW17463.1 hypothetical protein ALO98_200278 [Pseudomonas syringae pv. tagetis]
MSTKTQLGLSGTVLVWFNMVFGALAAIISLWALLATATDSESPSSLYAAGILIGLAFSAMGYLRWSKRAGKPIKKESKA